eukprot:m51a1_g5107 putative cugbp elav-like family member 3 isoform x9 (392) ;mRNA; r:324342-327377
MMDAASSTAPRLPPNVSETLRNATKLFIGQVPRHFSEADLRPLFDPYGPIIEVAIIRQRATGESRGCAFVTYKQKIDAENAMAGLHNKVHLPGAANPLQVRYAESGATRPIVEQEDVKLFIGKVPNTATEEDLRPVFEPYGRLVEVAVLRGHDGVSKGCAFVRYRSRDEALAAINALDGKYRMPNGPTELVVRFSESRREKQERCVERAVFGGMPDPMRSFAAATGGFNPSAQLFQIQQQIAQLQAAQAQLQMIQRIPPAAAPSTGYVPPAARYPPQPAAMPMPHDMPPSSTSPPPKQNEGPSGANLFIYHLPKEFTDSDLANAFTPFGNLLSARVFVDKETGASKCFGFVSYSDPAAAQAAIAAMNGYAIGDKRLKVQIKHEHSKTSRPY